MLADNRLVSVELADGTIMPVREADVVATAAPMAADPDCVANYLNSNEVATIIQENGFRLWGNRTCSDDPLWAFLSVRRTHDHPHRIRDFYRQCSGGRAARPLRWYADEPDHQRQPGHLGRPCRQAGQRL